MKKFYDVTLTLEGDTQEEIDILVDRLVRTEGVASYSEPIECDEPPCQNCGEADCCWCGTTTYEECQRSYGPHYNGPCEHDVDLNDTSDRLAYEDEKIKQSRER